MKMEEKIRMENIQNKFRKKEDKRIKKIVRETMGDYKAANFLSLLWEFFDSGVLDINEFSDDGSIHEMTDELHAVVMDKIVEKYRLVLKDDYSNLVLLYTEEGWLCAFMIIHHVAEGKRVIDVYAGEGIKNIGYILLKLGLLLKKDFKTKKIIKAWATNISGTRFKKDGFLVVPIINFADLLPTLPEPIRKITYKGGVVFGAPGTGKTVFIMQTAKIVFDFYEENWETKNYEDFKFVNPVYSYSFDELLKNMDSRPIQLLFCDDALLLQSKNVCNNAAIQLSRIRHIYQEKSSTSWAVIHVLFVAQELFELTKGLRAQLHHQVYKSLSINDFNQRVIVDRLGRESAAVLLDITRRILGGDDSAMCESIVRMLGEGVGKIIMPEYDQKEFDLVFSKFKVIDPFIRRDVVGISRRRIPTSTLWFNFLKLFIEEIDKANLIHVLSHYKISTEYEFWTDRIQRWFEYYFESKEYEEIDDLHGDSSTDIYLVAIRKFMTCAEMNHVKERASEKFVFERISEAIKQLIFLAETEKKSTVKTKPLFSFSGDTSFSFSEFNILQNCKDHRKGSMSNDICIHFRGSHLLSINVKFTLKTPDKFLKCSPETDFRPAALCNINVDYSKANRGAWVSFQILKGSEDGLRLKSIEVVGESGSDIWLAIAARIFKLIKKV